MTTTSESDNANANASTEKKIDSTNLTSVEASSSLGKFSSSIPPVTPSNSRSPTKGLTSSNTGADGAAGGVLPKNGASNTYGSLPVRPHPHLSNNHPSSNLNLNHTNTFTRIPDSNMNHPPPHQQPQLHYPIHSNRDRSTSLGSPIPSPHRPNPLRNTPGYPHSASALHNRSTAAAAVAAGGPPPPPINAFTNVPLLPNLAVGGMNTNLHNPLGTTFPTPPCTPDTHLHGRTIAHISNIPDMILQPTTTTTINHMNTNTSASSASPTPSINSHQSSAKAAIDAAMAQERQRAKDLETTERETFTEIGQYQYALKQERSYSAKLAGELAALRSAAVASHSEAEVHEEGRINGLMRRLDGLQREKERIIVELEREEEMLTNTLQKKLNEVRREKAQLQKQIEKEHTFNSELQSKLSSVQSLSKSEEQAANVSGMAGTSTKGSYSASAATLTSMMEETSMED